MQKASVSINLAGDNLEFKANVVAPQSTSSILARLGDTMVLVTVVLGKKRDDLDYFPLSVEYREAICRWKDKRKQMGKKRRKTNG
jgi:polyribonucleotide nucleotidyltransferase